MLGFGTRGRLFVPSKYDVRMASKARRVLVHHSQGGCQVCGGDETQEEAVVVVLLLRSRFDLMSLTPHSSLHSPPLG